MGFLAICTALYDYQPQSEEELEIKEGELLFILEKDSGDDWWKAKKKAEGDDEDEPEGLIPYNYVEDAQPSHHAKALYDYTRQTDEEVSFEEDASMHVYDTSDPDWTLVGVNGEYGFVPANYIEKTAVSKAPAAIASPPTRVPVPTNYEAPDRSPTPTSPVSEHQSAAAALAKVIGGGAQQSPIAPRAPASPPTPRDQQQFTPDASDDDEQAPALPQRPPSQTISSQPAAQQASYTRPEPQGVLPSPPYNRAFRQSTSDEEPVRSSGGYHLYNISEMVSVMGRRKKMPTTLGLNLATGTIMLSPEKTRDGPTQEWSADKLSHYSIEGKHVFMELVRPSKSLDLHAGAKDTAQEIVRSLGEIAGAQRAEGFKEVIAAASGTGSGQKRGVVLYDFMAQGNDEVTVAVGDEVIVLDDEKSEEWWNVRRVKNGSEGVMPSSYIEVTGIVAPDSSGRSGTNAGKSTVEQNRLEEERLAREAARANRATQEAEEARSREIQLPQRGSSLGEEDPRRAARKDKKSGRNDGKSRSKPDPSKTRTWTDHSGSFKVEAQFIGIADGKVHLHKINGVKIAVPVTKMSPGDLEYVEKVIHESIEEHIPVADLIKLKRKNQIPDSSSTRAGASIEPPKPQTPEYDWFEFFLAAGVGPHQCERYAQAMVKDSMDESVLPDITTDSLRTLGLKEGDALKVMKHLDAKFNRTKVNGTGESSQGGLFSGPGGALHVNTRRRPDSNRQTGDVVDANAFDQGDTVQSPAGTRITNLSHTTAQEPQNGFEDDAWEVKPSTKSMSPVAPIPTPAAPQKPVSENVQALSLLDRPLEPTPAAPARPASQPEISQQQPTAPVSSLVPVQSQQTGANPAFFSQLNHQSQVTGQANTPRQRPQAPQQNFTGSALLPPPPRPTSAPQTQLNQYGQQQLQPQLTGITRSAALQAAPGQSLDEMTAQRLQQLQLQSQPGYLQPYGTLGGQVQTQPTGFQSQQPYNQFQQTYSNGNVVGSPFADPRSTLQPQQTGYNLQPGPAPGSLNSVLPPALIPQKTGYQTSQPQMLPNGFNATIQPQATGFVPTQAQMTGYQQPMQLQSTGWNPSQQNGFANVQLPPVPPLPQQITPAPLMPQKTGPAPNVQFGVTAAQKLAPQPTGRRANLAAATPQNPFGF